MRRRRGKAQIGGRREGSFLNSRISEIWGKEMVWLNPFISQEKPRPREVSDL